jgi:hypothetical protein
MANGKCEQTGRAAQRCGGAAVRQAGFTSLLAILLSMRTLSSHDYR